jgi:hypothetical protein
LEAPSSVPGLDGAINIDGSDEQPNGPPGLDEEQRQDAAIQLDVIETNGLALGQILGNIIDSLDIGKSIQSRPGEVPPLKPQGLSKTPINASTSTMVLSPGSSGLKIDIADPNTHAALTALKSPTDENNSSSSSSFLTGSAEAGATSSKPGASDIVAPQEGPAKADLVDFALELEKVVLDGMTLEHRMRTLAGQEGLDKVEVIVEVLPRTRGGWQVRNNAGPLLR